MPISAEDREYFEGLGRDRVFYIATTTKFRSPRQIFALEWLAERDASERLTKDASQAEQINIARSAAAAAWEAAHQAQTANKIAATALVGAAIAIIVSIISLVRSH